MGGSKEEMLMVANPTLKAFYEETGYEMQCDKICGQAFKTLAEPVS